MNEDLYLVACYEGVNYYENNECVEKCSKGYFHEKGNHLCEKCNDSCLTCENINNNCTSCKEDE